MCITSVQAATIRSLTAEVFGPAAQVRLFGSRATDSSKGGDIDLMVSCPAPIERPALLAARLAARLQLSLGDQHIDIVLEAPNLSTTAIHRIAREEGILL